MFFRKRKPEFQSIKEALEACSQARNSALRKQSSKWGLPQKFKQKNLSTEAMLKQVEAVVVKRVNKLIQPRTNLTRQEYAKLQEAIAWVDKQDAATKHLQKLRDAAQALRLPLEELNKGSKGKEAAKNVRQALRAKGALKDTVRSLSLIHI